MKKHIYVLVLGMLIGASIECAIDFELIHQAHQNEAQANGLEDECKATLAERTK